MGAENIINILMQRDCISEEDAWRWFNDGMSEVMEAIEGTSCLDPEEVFMQEFGLEPDYLLDLI